MAESSSSSIVSAYSTVSNEHSDCEGMNRITVSTVSKEVPISVMPVLLALEHSAHVP